MGLFLLFKAVFDFSARVFLRVRASNNVQEMLDFYILCDILRFYSKIKVLLCLWPLQHAPNHTRHEGNVCGCWKLSSTSVWCSRGSFGVFCSPARPLQTTVGLLQTWHTQLQWRQGWDIREPKVRYSRIGGSWVWTLKISKIGIPASRGSSGGGHILNI